MIRSFNQCCLLCSHQVIRCPSRSVGHSFHHQSFDGSIHASNATRPKFLNLLGRPQQNHPDSRPFLSTSTKCLYRERGDNGSSSTEITSACYAETHKHFVFFSLFVCLFQFYSSLFVCFFSDFPRIKNDFQFNAFPAKKPLAEFH